MVLGPFLYVRDERFPASGLGTQPPNVGAAQNPQALACLGGAALSGLGTLWALGPGLTGASVLVPN